MKSDTPIIEVIFCCIETKEVREKETDDRDATLLVFSSEKEIVNSGGESAYNGG